MGDPLWNPPNTGPRFHSSWLTSGEKPRTGTIELGVRDPLDVAYSYNPLIQLGYSSYIYSSSSSSSSIIYTIFNVYYIYIYTQYYDINEIYLL